MDIQALVDTIDGSFPELAVTSIELAGEGMDSIALLVNREWIFRFPKHDGVSARVELEARLLPELQPVVDVRIPVPVFVGTDPRTGRRFSGYGKVERATLDAHVFPGLDTRRQDSVTAQIARFVRQLHSLVRPGRTPLTCGVWSAPALAALGDSLVASTA